MTELLIKKFVNNYEAIGDVKVRNSYGKLSGIVGIILNLILCGIKMTIGLISGSISIVGDAIHNLADGGASIITMLGFKLASEPADKEHPFGHGRIEYVAGLIIAGAIMLIGFELLESSIDKLLNPVEGQSSLETIIILMISVALQLWLGLFNRKLGKKIKSPAMLAASTDSLSDCVATVVVIACQIIHYTLGIDLDAHAGIIVALFIMHSGWGAGMDTIQPLLGAPPDEDLIKNIRDTVLGDKRIIGVHDLIVHNYGPGRLFVSLHAEVPSDMKLLEAHDIVDDMEEKLNKKFNAMFTIHLDPQVLNDPYLKHLKAELKEVLGEIAPNISFHDARIVAGVNLVFDVAVPYDCQKKDKEILEYIIGEMAMRQPNYKIIMRVDRVF